MEKLFFVATIISSIVFTSCDNNYETKDINTNPVRTGSVKALFLKANPNHNSPDSIHINFSDYQQEGTSSWSSNIAINNDTEIQIKSGKHKLYGYSWGHTSDSRTVSTKTAPLFGKTDIYIGDVVENNHVEVSLEATAALVVIPRNTRIVDLKNQTEASENDFFNAQDAEMKATYVYVKSYVSNMGTEIVHEPREYTFITEGDSIKQQIEVGKAYILTNGTFSTQPW